MSDRDDQMLRLMLFACVYAEQRGVDPLTLPRSVEDYVGLAIEEVDASLFALLATAVARGIDRDLETPPSGPRLPEKSRGPGH